MTLRSHLPRLPRHEPPKLARRSPRSTSWARRQWAAVALAALTLTLVAGFGAGGCASTRGIARADAASMAAAGSDYAEAIDRLLTTAGRVQVDATSQRLVSDDALHNLTLEQYRAATREDQRRLAVLSRLQRHTRLLERYFHLLDDLAHGPAPERTVSAIQEVTGSLARLGDTLLPESGIAAAERGAVKGVGRASAFVLRRIDSARLRDELRERYQAIGRELEIQEHLLAALADDLRHDLAVVAGHREMSQVIAPLLEAEPISRPEGWIDRRRQLVTSALGADGTPPDPALDDLSQASRAAAALRASYEALLRGAPRTGHLDAALSRLSTALDTVDAVADAHTGAFDEGAGPSPRGDER